MIICGTGHRPEVCPEEGKWVRFKIMKKLEHTLESAAIDRIITGMAAGFDLWFADEAIALEIPVTAAVPWKGHSPRKEDIDLYTKILDYADDVVYIHDKMDFPGPWVYHKRNEWMVDHATNILTYYNGQTSGGTFACLKYARKVGLPIYNCIEDPPF